MRIGKRRHTRLFKNKVKLVVSVIVMCGNINKRISIVWEKIVVIGDFRKFIHNRKFLKPTRYQLPSYTLLPDLPPHPDYGARKSQDGGAAEPEQEGIERSDKPHMRCDPKGDRIQYMERHEP